MFTRGNSRLQDVGETSVCLCSDSDPQTHLLSPFFGTHIRFHYGISKHILLLLFFIFLLLTIPSWCPSFPFPPTCIPCPSSLSFSTDSHLCSPTLFHSLDPFSHVVFTRIQTLSVRIHMQFCHSETGSPYLI